MLSYKITGIDNGFRLGTSLPHEFSSSLENVVNKVFGSFVSNSVCYKLNLYKPVMAIQKISLVVEKATNGFFISVGSTQKGFESDIEAIKYFCLRLADLEITNIELVQQTVNLTEQLQVKQIPLSTIMKGLEEVGKSQRLQKEAAKVDEQTAIALGSVSLDDGLETVSQEHSIESVSKALDVPLTTIGNTLKDEYFKAVSEESHIESVSEGVDGVPPTFRGVDRTAVNKGPISGKSRLISILSGVENYQLRPGETPVSFPPLEKRQPPFSVPIRPEPEEKCRPDYMNYPPESDVGQLLRDVAAQQPRPLQPFAKKVPDPHCLFTEAIQSVTLKPSRLSKPVDKTARPELVEKIASRVGDLDVSKAQPLTPEELAEAEKKIQRFREDMKEKTVVVEQPEIVTAQA